MTHEGVLDTNCVVLYEDLPIHELPDHPVMTCITLSELTAAPLLATDPGEMALRQVRLQVAETTLPSLPFDVPAARAHALVTVALRRAGRKPEARRYDTMIAAIAISRGLPLFTTNPNDFRRIDGLQLVAVWHPEAET